VGPARAIGLWCAALAVLAPAAAAGLDVVGRSEVRVAWTSPAGEIAAYVVFVSRDGGPYRSEQYTREASAHIAGRLGESVQVLVRAYGATADGTVTSPPSEPSELIRFLGDAPPASLAVDAAPLPSSPPRPLPAARLPPSFQIQAGGDFDGDGDLDLIATLGSWDHPLVLFQKEGALERVACLAPLGRVGTVSTGDFDGDGKDELVVQSSDAVSLLRLEASGKATLLRRETLSAEARILVADLDGDGQDSLVVYEPSPGRLTVRFAGRQASDFGASRPPDAPQPVDFGAIGPLDALYAGDFDGDGRDDLWVQASPGSEAELWLMRPQGGFDVTPVLLDGSLSAAVALDWNGDGRDDLAGYDTTRGELRAWLLDGAQVIERRALAQGPIKSLRALDLDGDERDDLLIVAPDGTTTELFAGP
jgi:hypothetical protein